MKILLAVDGSEFTKHMLAYLAARDELIGKHNQFTVLTVVTPVPAQVTHFITRESIDDYYKEQAESVLRPIQAFAAQKGWEVTTQQAVGHAAELICSTATQGNYDMIVIGSHGHSTLGSLVMGSVVSRVLSGCKTPVLVIR
jgi:nucleotide-binding universal stress UspA family protein